MGLLDYMQSPEGIGLLSGLASYAANARRGTPVNNVGRGLVGGLAGYSLANEQVRKAEEDAFQKQYRQMQMEQMQNTLTKHKQEQEFRSRLPDMLKPKLTGSTEQGQMLAEQNADFGAEGVQPLVEAAQYATDAPLNMSYGVDKQALQEYMMQPGSPYADKIIEKQLTPKDPIKLGNTLLDPETYQPLAVDEAWKQDKLEARQQRLQELEMRLEDQRLSREQSAALRRELAGQQAALRRDLSQQSTALAGKPPSGYRFKPNGDLEMIPGGPADVKNQQRLEGGSTVDTVIATLRDQYDQLEKGGGIVSTKNELGRNLGARLSSSGLGQFVGGAVGTENQSARDTVAQTRPVLLQAIMKATGMSAKQMDSNAELKLYLATATDPTLGLEANRNALAMIERLYGSGAGNEQVTREGESPKRNAPPQNKREAYNEYLKAYSAAKTPEQKKAITARARQLGVVK